MPAGQYGAMLKKKSVSPHTYYHHHQQQQRGNKLQIVIQ